MHFPRQKPCGSVPSSRSFDEGDPRTKSRFGTPQQPVPTPVAYGSGRRDALQFSLQSSSTAISASSSSSSRPGSKSPSAAARTRRRPALPWETPRVAFTSLTVIPREKSSAACWKIGREGILPNGRSLSVRQICTKSIHRPSRRAQAPTAPQCERAAIGPSIARQDHVLDDRIDLGLPALAGEHAVVAYAGLHVVALKIGSQLAA
jgi:hypothetical protein